MKADYETLSQTGIRTRRKIESLKGRFYKEYISKQDTALHGKHIPKLPPFFLQNSKQPEQEFLVSYTPFEPWINYFFERKTLQHPIPCYICKKKFSKVHHFYDSLCPDCAVLNFQKRNQSEDLSGNIIFSYIVEI